MTGGKAGGEGNGAYPFLGGDSEMARRIAAFDWAATELGPISAWPQSLKSTIGMMLLSPVPIALLWGENGVMIYNDGYAEVAGGRHPAILGSQVLDGWPEIADFNRNVIEVGLAGGTLSYRDQEMMLNRSGAPEKVWLNLDYSPVMDDEGKPAASLPSSPRRRGACRRKRTRTRLETLRQMFEQAAGLHRDPGGTGAHLRDGQQSLHEPAATGMPSASRCARLLPEIVDQGFIELLDRVRKTEEPYIGRGIRVLLQREAGSEPVERYLDFVFHPVSSAQSNVRGIFVQGHDVTEQRLAEIALRESEERFRLVAESAPVKTVDGRCRRKLHLPERDAAPLLGRDTRRGSAFQLAGDRASRRHGDAEGTLPEGNARPCALLGGGALPAGRTASTASSTRRPARFGRRRIRGDDRCQCGRHGKTARRKKRGRS